MPLDTRVRASSDRDSDNDSDSDSDTPLPPPATGAVPVPAYLQDHYWWAYLHPRAVRIFERKWLANLILLGHYAPLREAALDATMDTGTDARPVERVLQVACVYGDLTPSLLGRLGPQGQLAVVDVAAIQLRNLERKLPADPRVALLQRDSTALGYADASQDRVLLFFLLHEQPEAVRRASLAEALRVLRPGGRIILVDYHGPSRWHPLRGALALMLARLEPYALDLWRHPILDFFPADADVDTLCHRTWFGGLYQLLVLKRSDARA